MTPASPLPCCPPPSRPQALLSPALCSWALPQRLGVEECSCQEEGEEAEAQPGEQSHLLRRSDPGFCCPSPSRTELLPTSRATSQRTLVPGLSVSTSS